MCARVSWAKADSPSSLLVFTRFWLLVRVKACGSNDAKKSKGWLLFFFKFSSSFHRFVGSQVLGPKSMMSYVKRKRISGKCLEPLKNLCFFVVFVALGMSRTRFACVPFGTKLVGHSNAGLGAFRGDPNNFNTLFDVENLWNVWYPLLLKSWKCSNLDSSEKRWHVCRMLARWETSRGPGWKGPQSALSFCASGEM